MSTTEWDTAVTALVTAYKAAPGLAGVVVYDGPQVTFADPDFIVVGHDGTIAADGTLATSTEPGGYTQRFIDFDQGAPREEEGRIRCVAVSQTGDPAGVAGRRSRVIAFLAAAEDAAAAGGGKLVSPVVFEGTSEGRFLYRQVSSGIAVMAAYTVVYTSPW